MRFVEQDQSAAIQVQSNFKTYWSTGRSGKTCYAENSVRTLTQEDFNKGVPPLKIFDKSAGIKIGINADGVHVDGNISLTAYSDMKDKWDSIRFLLTKAETIVAKNENDSTLDDAVKYLPREFTHLSGKTYREIAEAINTPAELETIVNFLSYVKPGQERYAQTNVKRAASMKRAWNVKLAKNTFFSDRKSLVDVLLMDTQEAARYQVEPAWDMFLGLQNAISRDPLLAKELNGNSKESAGDSDLSRTYTLYEAVKVPTKVSNRQDGKVKCYTIKISCKPSQQPAPVKILIHEEYGTPDPAKQAVIKGTAVDAKTASFDLTRAEFANLVRQTDLLVENEAFRYLHFEDAFGLADYYRQQRYQQQYQAQQNTQSQQQCQYQMSPYTNMQCGPYLNY